MTELECPHCHYLADEDFFDPSDEVENFLVCPDCGAQFLDEE